MYGYYYETNILFFLRLAKYLHNQDPAALEKILNEMPEFDQYFSDDYCERITYAICSQVVFTDEDVMDEYTGEAIQISTCFFSHPLINRFCRLSAEWCGVCGQSTAAWQEKLSDIAEYYLMGASDTLFRMECYPKGGSAKIRVWFSPDCYDPIAFGNALVDMLLFLQQENERLEGLLNEAKIREEVA